jgi:hypothetical protein
MVQYRKKGELDGSSSSFIGFIRNDERSLDLSVLING